MKTSAITIVLSLLLLGGCSGEQQTDTAASTPAPDKPAVAETAASKGVGPVTEFDVSTLDHSRASEGAAIFEAKCTACHKIEERYIGPALTGVTKRREPEWILNMILNPDGMVKQDETAKSLLAEYLAPMTNQNLTEEEARLVLTYFLENDKGTGE